MSNPFTLPSEELQRLFELRHDLHAHPELGYEETRTSEVICRELTEAGIPFKSGLAGGTGVLAWLPGRNDDDAVALRADIDALPMEETSGVPWTSTHPGRMHACGHDGHTTILIGTARALASMDELPRPVMFLFQPAEEGGAGGRRMVQDGCLDGTVAPWKAKRIFGLHGWTNIQEGKVGTKTGPLLAAADHYEIDIHGTGAHAAMPHTSADPVLAAASVVTALQSIVARNVDPLDAAVVSATTINAGSAFNVIPCHARITGTARSLKAEVRDTLEQRIEQIAQQVAMSHNCRAEVRYERGYPVTINHPDAVAQFERDAALEIGEDRVVAVDRPFMGGEDFSYYGEVIPACFFLLGLLPEGEDSMPALHHPSFDFNDRSIETGVSVFRRLALGESA